MPEGTALYDRDSDARTGTDNDLAEMDNSMVIESHMKKCVAYKCKVYFLFELIFHSDIK